MATYFARKAGNINATDVWATTPSGTASNLFPTFTNADVLMSNSFAITVNVSTTVAEIRNDTTGGATNGGSFSLSAGVILTADLYNAAGVAAIITCAISAPSSASIVSNVIRNASSSGNSFAVSNTGSGTLNISVSNNITGGAGGSGVARAAGVNAAGGIVNITGNVTGGTHASAPGAQANGGTLNITGIVTGNVGPGAANMLTGTTTIIGQARGGASAVGAINESTGMLVATRAVGNGYGPGNVAGLAATVGISNAGLGVVEIQELEYGTFGQSPTSGTGIRLKKASSNVAVFNYCDTAGAKTLIDATQNAAMPAASNVRSGVSYASGALTGTCAVPSPATVATGVPIDATVGTAALSAGDVAAAVWGAASRTITGGTVDTLTNPPIVPTVVQIRQEMDSNSTKLANLDATISSRSTLTTGDLPSVPSAASVASAVRTELTELANLDASVSSRLASASYTAPANSDISAIKSKTDNLPASPAAVSDIPTAAQIATAVEGSLLNEADGQAVLNAIVGAIGNTNLSEVSLVAAVRADLERNGGKLINLDAAISSRLAAADYSAPTSAPTAASVATAVWGAATKEITGGTVTTLTNSPDVPTEAEIASQVRTELSVELGRIDAAISSRLAPSGTLATVTTLTNAPTSVTPTDIWTHATRTITGGTVDTLTNAPTVPTAASIRAEIDSNSTQLAAIKSKTDALPVSPAATGDIPTADITAIKAKTDLLETTRLAQCSTVATTGAQLAAALS